MSTRFLRCMASSALILTLTGCAQSSQHSILDSYGANPNLPEPKANLFPTVNIAPAKGWPEGMMPTAAAHLKVQAFAADLQHPRWLYVLPNGDVLVAETDAPPKPDDTK